MQHLFPTLFFVFLFFAPIAQAQNLKKEWAFVNKEDGRMRRFKQGQNIAVKWRGLSGIKTTKGRLADITADSLILSIDDYIGSMAKKDIEEITRKRRGLAGQVMLVLAGIFITGFFILLQSISDSTRLDVQLASGEKKLIWPWAFVGLGLIALGFRSPTMRISKPFDKDWKVQEIPAKTNEMP